MFKKILVLLLFFSFNLKAEDLSVGFIYKKSIPEEAFYLFDWLIVDPDNFSPEYLKEKFYIRNKKSKLIAYVSLGEAEPYRSYYSKVKKEWIIGENKGWNSKIVDLRVREYVDFLFENVFNNLGYYDGFFLDTLDSYQLVLKKEEERKAYEEAMVEVISRLRKLYPQKIILINRGFEIVDKVAGSVNGMVAESLFYGLEIGKEIKYKKMKEEDTKWLLERLNYAKSKGLKIIVIDYVEPKNKKLQREVAKKIYELGFIPYVSDKFLNTVGTSLYQLKPRKILFLYDKPQELDIAYVDIHRHIQPWVEYIGYVPVLRDVNEFLDSREFNEDMSDQYRAIFLRVASVNNSGRLAKWLKERKEEGIKIFFFRFVPFSEEEHLKIFNIKKLGQLGLLDRYEITKSTFPFFESQPVLENINLFSVENPRDYIEVKSGGKTFYPLAITDWGGYALDGTLTIYSGKDTLFGVNPVEFFERFLKPDFPIPDVTTENGRRILTAHIDGDAGFGVADFDSTKNLMEITRDEIIKKYKIPHTVSIIEGEIAPYGLYPEKSKKLEEIAKSIFQLENVEASSHSFSHPFRWQTLERLAQEKESITENYNLNIKDYKFDLNREIIGSVEYINKNLLPEGKKTKVFLWTGDCIPSKNALKLTYQLGIYNVNGGYTQINRREPFFSYISSMGLDRDGYFQVYPPIQNENIYTNLWKDYYGYRRVIETFEMTEKPYRLKPISIYYHFYSAQKVASLKALREVYDYALSQKVNPMFLSEYAQRVLEFRSMAIAEDIRDGSTVIRSEGNLKTVRVDRDRYPDIKKGKGMLGFEDINGVRYIHLDNSGDYRVILSSEKPCFYLKDSNGQIWESNFSNGMVSFRLKSSVSLEYNFYCNGCNFNIKPNPDELRREGNFIIVRHRENTQSYVETSCKK